MLNACLHESARWIIYWSLIVCALIGLFRSAFDAESVIRKDVNSHWKMH